ncbi:Trihelix transcription factor GT-2 [Acorus gramineus]|uniref:Trihelix transcription factor GT-2 n=1 Tax=Acorus gramineus TaxID=55184 RepID=A0AAV9B9I8_ACOGR|nr:Trihelix transcription factor GT-2 [Acorus gramineus]
MQSSFNVPELQQFMVDNCCSPLFSISTADLNINGGGGPPKHHHQHHHPPPPPQLMHHHHPQQQRFLHPVPITQQFLEQYNTFHAYEQQRRLHHHLGLDQGPSGSDNPPAAAFLAPNFKLSVNVNDSGGGDDDKDEGLLRGDDGSDGRGTSVTPHRWQREEGSSIKQPFWKPLEIDYINRNNNDSTTTTNNNDNNNDNNNHKRMRDKLGTSSSPIKYFKKSNESSDININHNSDEGNHSGSNYGIFGELEAIYSTHGGGAGSALTIENHPSVAQLAAQQPALRNPIEAVDRGSDASIGEEPPQKKPTTAHQKPRKKKSMRRHLTSMAAFFEGLMNKLTEQQECLHKTFLDAMERRDRERTERDEAWRRQEASRTAREAATRAQERALAFSREAAIVSFLENFTGETINLPTAAAEKEEVAAAGGEQSQLANPNRWPKAEVQALIRVRSGLETRFQEPALKGPLWEEVSSSMARLGYRRSAKRCKEKWENINKYFRKTKDSPKKRPQHTKTCPYFQQLDQLYSNKAPPPIATNAAERKDDVGLLQAMIGSAEKNPHHNYVGIKVGEMENLSVDFDNAEAGKGLLELGRGERRIADEGDDEGDDHDDDDDDDECNEEGEEGEGDNQEHIREQEREHSHSTSLLFGLES